MIEFGNPRLQLRGNGMNFSKTKTSTFGLAVSMAATASSCLASNQSDNLADTEKIKQLNREQQQELLLNKNAEPLERLAVDQYLVIAPGGRVETKAQAVVGVGSLDVRAVEFSQEQVIFYNDTAVLVGKIDIDGTMQPLGKFPPMKFMATFVRTEDGWKTLSRSMTPCAPIAIEHGVC
ncbi:nuclear transport factor 2 family protein [Hyphococcus flavus]|uniref:Nuclear transport factor 2 family protein n=1 Tax=Hyphococcus flavus TaxID=1866326 RepID=A0AAE9ZLZ4_9PROT|nr:nuclear transport factor 2 family protein [Hyphococcus flavus]WDI33225.1 nuclear transport factor 2 family protein [Hyphococcus flavus]